MAAHVSAVPNHQVGRVTPLSTRAGVAFFGVFGYELDPTTLDDEERAEIADQIAFYARHRELFQRGRFIRLVSPFDGDRNHVAWMAVSEDRSQAVVGTYRILGRPDPGPERLRLRGLDPGARYTVTGWPAIDDRLTRANAGERSGAELMAAGLVLNLERWETVTRGDFWARLFVLEAIPPGT
jgi:alpha-galactosidase